MKLLLKDNLPFATVIVTHKGQKVEIPDVLIDTGSGTTILNADIMQFIHITPMPEDTLYAIRGIGGSEVVFARRVDTVQMGECTIHNFVVEIGGMDYGFKINGIIGMDFLVEAGAIIDLRKMVIGFSS